MRTTQLGSNGPDITVIGFGAWEAGGDMWGRNESEDAVIGAMRAGFDAGMNWIDTAEVYGKGVSEGIVGRARGRAPGPGHRGLEARSGVRGLGVPSGAGPRGMPRASLGRLGIDVIDLYQLHWPDATGVPIEDTWGAMAELQDAGTVRWIGVSNFDQALIERCEAIRHVDSLQQEFSMLALDDRDLIRWCGEHGTGVVTYGPLGFGLLTGTISRERATSVDGLAAGRRGRPVHRREARPRPADRRRAATRSPSASDITMAQLALAWNVAQPGVTSAIAGSRDADAHARQRRGGRRRTGRRRRCAEIEGLLTG